MMPDEEHVDLNCDINTSVCWMLSTFNKAEGVPWVMGNGRAQEGERKRSILMQLRSVLTWGKDICLFF